MASWGLAEHSVQMSTFKISCKDYGKTKFPLYMAAKLAQISWWKAVNKGFWFI